jgi:acetyl-CoA acetyltransferase
MKGTVAVTGIGYGPVGRALDESEGQLALVACRAAMADAGLERNQIDGLAMFPVRSSPPTPFQGPSLTYVQRSLGLPNLAFRSGTSSDMGQFGGILAAIGAITAGLCRHVLVYRAHKRQTRRYLPASNAVDLQFDEEAFTVPYGGSGGTARFAAWALRHMHEFGTTQEQLGAIVVNARQYAAHHPRAYWKGKPVTLDDYMASRWVATPFKVLDCDIPVDGATALLLSSSAAAADCSSTPVYIEAGAGATGPETSWTHWLDKTHMASKYVGERLWAQTSLTQADVDVAEVYDGFSFMQLCWIEDLGFVPKGKGGPFFQEGGGRLDSTLPVNTDGGQLGGGRLHGFGRLAEATAQLRGTAFHQVKDAEVAIAAAAGGPLGGALLLTRERRARA